MRSYPERRRTLEALLSRARSGQRPLGISQNQESGEGLEMAAMAGFEWVSLNQEHSLVTLPGLAHLARIAESAGMVYFVKLARWDPLLARDALDVGAYGIQVPFVNSGEMVREVVEAIRFPPHGKRGICPSARGIWYGAEAEGASTNQLEYIRFQNDGAVIIPYVEDKEGLENLDDILAFDECPIIGLGGLDLAFSLGIGEAVLAGDSEQGRYFEEVLGDVSDRAHRAGKLVMTSMEGPSLGFTLEDAAERLAVSDVDLPYQGDGALLGYGLMAAKQIRDRATEVRAGSGQKGPNG